MENTNIQTSKIETPKDTSSEVVINSFVGRESEYEKFIDSLYKNIRLIKGILHIFPSDKIKEQVDVGLNLANKILDLNRKKSAIDNELKKYGAELISLWNKSNPAQSTQVSSVRMVSEDNHSILISTRDSYSIKSDALLLLKDELGENFDEIFETNETLTVKEEETPKQILLTMLCKNFGEKALSFFFNKKLEIKMKDSKKYNDILESDMYSENLKNRLKFACSKASPAIIYPK